jgi:hypothetical protein
LSLAADPFAKMTLAVSLAVAVLVSASLLVLPLFQSGDLGPLRFLLAFAGVAFVLCAIAGRARGVAHGATPAAERSMKATKLVSLAAVCSLLVPCVAVGILDAPAQRLLAFAFKNPLATVPVGVATATVLGTTVVAFIFFRKAQNAAAVSTPTITPFAVPPVA